MDYYVSIEIEPRDAATPVEQSGYHQPGTMLSLAYTQTREQAQTYELWHWTRNGERITNVDEVQIEGDDVFVGKFRNILNSVDVSVDSNLGGSGTVTVTMPDGKNGVPNGGSATITAVAYAGSEFLCWSDGSTDAEREIKDINCGLSFVAIFGKAEA